MNPSTRYRVLLVEDDEHDAIILRRHIERMARIEIELDWSEDIEGVEALKAAHEHDLVLLDLGLRGSTGLSSLDRLRAVCPQVPVVVLTGRDDMAVEAVRAGAQDFLNKDELTAAMLERTLVYAVERHRLTDMVARSDRMASVGQLAAGVAHELNSPLAQVRDELVELAGQISDDGARGTLERALARLEDIRSTVEALYGFSSVQRGRREVFDADKAVRLAWRLSDNALRHVAVAEASIDALPSIHADQGRFTQAVLDLLGHAAEVSKGHRGRLGRVWLEAREEPGQVLVAVEDDGPVVPVGQRERLFQPFGYARAGEGGLALAAAHDLAREAGGTLRALNGSHGGMRFELRIPAAAPVATEARAPRASSAPAERARVLWIDDDVHLLRAFQRRLQRDHDVDVCETAAEALRRIEAGERWDVICCDLMMPGINGREFDELLAERYPELATRLVFVTGGVFTEEERRFLESTRQPRLLKPFDWSDLLEAVEEIRSSSTPARADH